MLIALLLFACGQENQEPLEFQYLWEPIAAPHPNLVCWTRIRIGSLRMESLSGEGVVCMPVQYLQLPKERGES